MAALEGGAVSYEQGTPVWQVGSSIEDEQHQLELEIMQVRPTGVHLSKDCQPPWDHRIVHRSTVGS